MGDARGEVRGGVRVEGKWVHEGMEGEWCKVQKGEEQETGVKSGGARGNREEYRGLDEEGVVETDQ